MFFLATFTCGLKVDPSLGGVSYDSPAEQMARQHVEPAQAEGLSVTVAEGMAIVQVQLTISDALQRRKDFTN